MISLIRSAEELQSAAQHLVQDREVEDPARTASVGSLLVFCTYGFQPGLLRSSIGRATLAWPTHQTRNP